MAAFAFVNCGVLLDDDEWSAQTSNLSTDGTVNMVPVPNMGGGGYAHFVPGVANFSAGFSGYTDFSSAAAIGSKMTQADIGSQKILTLTPTVNAANAVAGDPAFIHRGVLSSAKLLGGEVGAAATFDFQFTGDTATVTGGYVGAPLASRTTAGLTGTAVALTGPTAAQRLYASLHVTAASGTNLAVKVQSDNAVGFPSPTDRITFSTVSAVGAQFSSVAGDLSTESHWRVTATIATGTFSFAVFFGVA